MTVNCLVGNYFQWRHLGLVASGYKIHTYTSGTTTPLATYTDSTGGTANSNPITLPSNGKSPIWLTANTPYRITLKDPTDTTVIHQQDNVYPLMNVTGFSSPGSGTLGLTAFASTTPNTLLGTNNLGTYQNIGLPAGVFTINSANYLNYPSSNRRLLGSFSFSNASATHQSTLVLGSEYLSPYHALEIYIDGGITTANENTLLFSSNGGVSYITSAGSYVYSDIALCGLGTVSTVWQYEVSDTRVPLTYDASAQSGGSNIAGDNSNTGNLFTRIFITNHNSNTQPTYFRLDTDEYVYNGGGSEQFFRSYKTGVLSSAGITNAVKLTLNDYNTNGGVFVEVYGITNVT